MQEESNEFVCYKDKEIVLKLVGVLKQIQSKFALIQCNYIKVGGRELNVQRE